jgi:hypothetical protein
LAKEKDYYQILGVDRNASQADLKKAFYQVRDSIRIWLRKPVDAHRLAILVVFRAARSHDVLTNAVPFFLGVSFVVDRWRKSTIRIETRSQARRKSSKK